MLDERWNGVLDLGPDAERLSARDEHFQPRALREESTHRRGGLDDLLEVVEHEQQPLRADVLGEIASGRQRPCDRAEDEIWVAECGQTDPVNAVGKGRRRLRCRVDPKPRLARPSGPAQGHESHLVVDQ